MNKIKGIVILSILFFSCSSDLDFNQVNDLKVEPVVIANLATFDVLANQFVIGGVEQPISGDLLDFNIFKDSYFNNSLTRADFFFEINNTIARAYKINLVFFDANNSPLYSIPFDVPAYTGVPVVVTKTEIFQGTDLTVLKNTSKLGFAVVMPPGVPVLTASSLGSLKLRSSATLYLVLE
jgi:hypothetical protein